MVRTVGEAQLDVPDAFCPERADRMLPQPNAADLRQAAVAGWVRMGIVAAIVDRSGRVMMLEHKGSDKTPDGALGPLSETAQFASGANGIAVESAAHTLSRAIHEELGVDRPMSLVLRARRIGAWAINRWPVGIHYEGQHALAVCPVAHIDPEPQAELLRSFTETDEVRGVVFMRPEAVLAHPLTRPGVKEWMRGIIASGLMESQPRYEAPIELPDPQPLAGGMDVKLQIIGHIWQ